MTPSWPASCRVKEQRELVSYDSTKHMMPLDKWARPCGEHAPCGRQVRQSFECWGWNRRSLQKVVSRTEGSSLVVLYR